MVRETCTGGKVEWQTMAAIIGITKTAAKVRPRLPGGSYECRRSVVHSLHVRFNRKAQRLGLAHHWRLSALFAALTHKYVFDYREGEIYWCTADIGWITGHSYIVYGPLCQWRDNLDV